MGMLGDYALILLSQRNEEKKIKAGKAKNMSLSSAVQQKRLILEMAANKGNADSAYKLGCMYIEGDTLGYDPELAVKYFKIAAEKDYFNALYALGMFHMAGWSYCHLDLYKSYCYFVRASKCNCSEPSYMTEVKRLLKDEFCISTKERDKNGNPMVWTKHNIKIK